MCSVQDEDNEVNFITAPEQTSLDHCKKCKSTNCPIILRKTDAYCENCFLIGTVHKFRATLGKSKLIRYGDRVLIAFSGDKASSILLHLIWDGLSESNFKKLRFHPIILYIDEGAVFNLSDEEREKNAKFASSLSEKSQIELFITSLSNVQQCSMDKNLSINKKIDESIKNLFANTTSLTAKQDLMKKIRHKLLHHCAKELKCSYILTAETATKLAATLLANVALGAGEHLHSDVGFCDNRNVIKNLRPLRDFTSEDVDYFISLKNVEYIEHNSLNDRNNSYASIQTLTDKFVNDLQKDFPATISTVMRTGEKLENAGTADAENICILCQSTLDTEMVSCSAIESIEISRKISNRLPPSVNGDCAENSGCSNCNCKKSEAITREDIERCLCYSCRLSLKDVKDITSLPVMITNAVRERKALSALKNEIQDFLL